MTNWDNCLDEGRAVSITPNPERVISLINSAKRRRSFVMEHKIEENNSEILFSDMYEGCLELLHALVIDRNYKVDNHICLGYYLRDIFKSQELFSTFDKYRKIRNNVLYYGALLDIKFTIKALKELNIFYAKLTLLL